MFSDNVAIGGTSRVNMNSGRIRGLAGAGPG